MLYTSKKILVRFVRILGKYIAITMNERGGNEGRRRQGRTRVAAQQKSARFHGLPDSEIYTTEYVIDIERSKELRESAAGG